MIIFDHWLVELVSVCLLCLAAGGWGWRFVRGKGKLARCTAGAGSLLLMVASGMLLFLLGCGSLWDVTTTSAPIYSPNRRYAVVVRTADAGALGGSTSVGVYSLGGLREDYIAGGEWKVVEEQNVRWLSNNEVRLGFEPSYRTGPNCVSTKAVKVVCVPAR